DPQPYCRSSLPPIALRAGVAPPALNHRFGHPRAQRELPLEPLELRHELVAGLARLRELALEPARRGLVPDRLFERPVDAIELSPERLDVAAHADAVLPALLDGEAPGHPAP